MTETINWRTMPDKDKIRLLLESLMGYFVLEETTRGYYTPEITKPVPAGFHWPIVFWNTDSECWVYKDIADNGVTFFDPLHDLNDAWLIIKKLYKQYDVRLFMEEENQAHNYVQIWHRHLDKMVGYGSSDTSMSEAICIAALRTQCNILEGVQH